MRLLDGLIAPARRPRLAHVQQSCHPKPLAIHSGSPRLSPSGAQLNVSFRNPRSFSVRLSSRLPGVPGPMNSLEWHDVNKQHRFHFGSLAAAEARIRVSSDGSAL